MAEEGETFKLPAGWRREEFLWRKWLSCGKTSVHYVSPEGRIIRTKAQLWKCLGHKYDLGPLDFRTGKIRHASKQNRFAQEVDYTPEDDAPQRVTQPMMQNPVTVIRNHPDSITRHDLSYGPQVKPNQAHCIPGRLSDGSDAECSL